MSPWCCDPRLGPLRATTTSRRAEPRDPLAHEGRARLAENPDSTYFDVDLFLSGAFLLARQEVVALLRERAASLRAQHADARALQQRMAGKVPLAGELIIEHRSSTWREASFADRAVLQIEAAPGWAPFLGDRSITDFLAEQQPAVEDDADTVGAPHREGHGGHAPRRSQENLSRRSTPPGAQRARARARAGAP